MLGEAGQTILGNGMRPVFGFAGGPERFRAFSSAWVPVWPRGFTIATPSTVLMMRYRPAATHGNMVPQSSLTVKHDVTCASCRTTSLFQTGKWNKSSRAVGRATIHGLTEQVLQSASVRQRRPAHQVAHPLLPLRRHPDGYQLPRPVQPRQLLCVLAVVLAPRRSPRSTREPRAPGPNGPAAA